MSAALQRVLETVQAGGTLRVDKPGKFCLVIAASGTFKIQFDSGDTNDVAGGFYFTNSFSKITLYNPFAENVTVEMFIGQSSVGFVGAFENKDAPTYAKGNLGISDASTLAKITNGYVKSASVAYQRGGNGYKVGNILTVAGGTGTAATIRVTAVGPFNGSIMGVEVLYPGSYTSTSGITSPNSVTGGDGSGAKIILNVVKPISGVTGPNPDGSLTLNSGNTLTIPGFDGVNRRKSIVFHCLAHGPLLVLDTNGCFFRSIPNGGVEIHVTSSDFQIKAVSGNNVNFVIGETYYGQQPN